MPNDYGEVDIKCPFFKKIEPTSMRCEGLIDNTVIHTQFQSAVKRELYQTLYCSRSYKRCRLYKALEKRYEEQK